MEEYKELKPKKDSFLYKKEELILPLNNQNSKKIDFDIFEDNLNISEIKDEFQKSQNEKISSKKIKDASLMIYNEPSIDKDFSVDLDNINEEEFNIRKVSICSLQSEEFNCSNINQNNKINKKEDLSNKKIMKKITKEDLNNIPLPLFSCIYCSNEVISFKHLSLEILTNKYLFQSSVYDIIELNKLIVYQPIIDKDNKNEKLIKLIIKNTEHINKYYKINNIYNFFNSYNYLNYSNKELKKIKRNFLHKIEESIIKKKKDFYFKGINIISKNSLNNKGLFNSTNSLINNCNALNGLVEPIIINNNINFGKNIINNYSNQSINFNSISSNNNETGNCVFKDNNNFLGSIVERIEKNVESGNEIVDKEEIMDFFKFDNERKIKKEDIIWEENYYNIWSPNISDIDINNDEYNKNSKFNFPNKIRENKQNKKNYKLKINLFNYNINKNSQISNNTFIYKLNKKLGITQTIDMGSTNNSSSIKNNIYNITKDYSNINNSQESVKKVENITNLKENSNYLTYINGSLNFKVNNKANILKNNYIKINSRFNHLNKIKLRNNSINNNNSQSYTTNINSLGTHILNSNNKFTKNETKILKFNKISKKNEIKKVINQNKKHKIKFNSIKLNNNNLNSYFNINNCSLTSKTINVGTNIVTPSSISLNRETEITSSKIKYKQNNKLLNSVRNNNINQKINKYIPKKIYLCSNYSNNNNIKNSININKNGIYKLNKMKKIYYRNGDYQQNNSKKINSSVSISNKNKNKNVFKFNLELGNITRKNIDNKKIDFNSKISINKKILPYSLINKTIT